MLGLGLRPGNISWPTAFKFFLSLSHVWARDHAVCTQSLDCMPPQMQEIEQQLCDSEWNCFYKELLNVERTKRAHKLPSIASIKVRVGAWYWCTTFTGKLISHYRKQNEQLKPSINSLSSSENRIWLAQSHVTCFNHMHAQKHLQDNSKL